jgi:hypothetical protein
MSMYGMHTIPLEAQYLYRRGIELSGQKRDEAAVRCLRQAIIISPRFTGASRELNACLARLRSREVPVSCHLALSRITA